MYKRTNYPSTTSTLVTWEPINVYGELQQVPRRKKFTMPAEGSVQEKGAMDWKGSLRRVIYPTGETIKNAENYKEAAARYEFGDNTKSRMWWDARKTIKE